MTNRKGKFKIKNGSGSYDQVMLETQLGQVVDSPIKSVDRSTRYEQNDVVAEQTCKGTFFICTTAGTTAASAPSGYSSVSEGGSVTDGTAVFTAHRFNNLANTAAITAHNSLETAHPNLDFVTQLNAAADGLHYRTRNGQSDQVIDLINQLQATLSQGTVPSGNTGTLAALLSGIVHQIKALSGKSNWWDTPKNNFETLSADGITGILPVAHGGTGTDSLANVTVGKAGTLVGDAGLWDYLHRLGRNPTLPTANAALNALGVFISYFDHDDKIANQPAQYGQLINIPADKGSESTQFWIDQYSGRMYHRGGNALNAINDTPFKRFLDTDDLSEIGVVGGNVSNANAWWVKLAGAVPLIIQGGFSSSGTFTYPISISTFLTGGVTTRMSSRDYDSDWGNIIGAPTSSYFRFRQNGYSDGTYCWLIGR